MAYKNKYVDNPWLNGRPPLELGSDYQVYGKINVERSRMIQLQNTGLSSPLPCYDMTDEISNRQQPMGSINLYGSERYNHGNENYHMNKYAQSSKMGSKGHDLKGDEDFDFGKNYVEEKPAKSWCNVCELYFCGTYRHHRRTVNHSRKHAKRFFRCRPCGKKFTTSEDYTNHRKTENHKISCAEFHCFKSLFSGSDEDVSANHMKIEPEKQPQEEKAEEYVQMQSSGARKKILNGIGENNGVNFKLADSPDNSTKKDMKTKKDLKTKPEDPKAQGLSFIVPVTGYFCKLCRKFFKDVTVAQTKHVQSAIHIVAYKNAISKALTEKKFHLKN